MASAAIVASSARRGLWKSFNVATRSHKCRMAGSCAGSGSAHARTLTGSAVSWTCSPSSSIHGVSAASGGRASLAVPVQVTVPETARELRDRCRPPGVGDAHAPDLGSKAMGLASLRFAGPKCHPQARRLIGEYDVADGQPAPGLVNYPVAGHHPRTGDVWWRRGGILRCRCAHEMAAVRSRGRSRGVIVDDGCACQSVMASTATGAAAAAASTGLHSTPGSWPWGSHRSPTARRYASASNSGTDR